jgi:hypothetical protein
MKTNRDQGMELSIDRMPGQWLLFARDWRPITAAVPEALCGLTDAMDGLLHAQQQTSALRSKLPSFGGSQQFTATFGISQWAPVNESILIDPTDQAINFNYQAGGQTCFKGCLTSILAPDDFGTYREPHAVLSPDMTLRKLYQFNTLFPWAQRLWIYLSTVVTSHFLMGYLKGESYEISVTPPRVLGFKAQFDQRALESRIGMLATHPLSYSATIFEVGRCDAITLTIYLANKLLMRIDLGLVKPSIESISKNIGPPQ